MRRARLALAVLVGCLAWAGVAAHEVRPGYLALRQVDAERYDVLWKVPARGDLRLSLHAELPENCVSLTPVSSVVEGGASVERWSARCSGGLTGRTIAIGGLSSTFTDVLVRIERADGSSQVARLSPTEPSFVVAAAPSMLEQAAAYLGLGVEHILLGVDHLLFVLALLILVEGRRRLVWTITAFTAAHSLTLAAATLGFVHVPPPPVEAVISLSIVFVACEIVHGRQGRPGVTERRPWLVAFAFGLLHGLGFAGALTRIGLPSDAVPVALLFFNVGVEAGQLLFVGACLLLAAAASRARLRTPSWGWRAAAYAIGSVAAFWTIERVARFWS